MHALGQALFGFFYPKINLENKDVGGGLSQVAHLGECPLPVYPNIAKAEPAG